jgi:hypothetical protein
MGKNTEVMNHQTGQYIHIFAELLMEISSKEDWIQRIPKELPAKIHPQEQFLWVDQYGFVLERGADFQKAEDIDAYPVRVYRTVKTSQVNKFEKVNRFITFSFSYDQIQPI